MIMTPEKDNKDIAGNKQSDFAGTNPDKYGDPKPANEQDNPIEDSEAQNVTDGTERISGKEAERARNKADEDIQQGRNK